MATLARTHTHLANSSTCLKILTLLILGLLCKLCQRHLLIWQPSPPHPPAYIFISINGRGGVPATQYGVVPVLSIFGNDSIVAMVSDLWGGNGGAYHGLDLQTKWMKILIIGSKAVRMVARL